MALENILSQEIVQKLGWTLLHFVWQAAAVALLLGILLAVLRKSSANLRYIIACAALGLIVLLPIVTMQLVPVSTPQPIANIEPAPATVIMPAQEFREIPAVEMSIPEGPVQHENAGTAYKASWKQRAADLLEPALPYIVSAWLLGVFGLSLWHLGGWAQLQRLRKKMVRQVDESLYAKLRRLSERLRVKRAVLLAESALVQVPTVVGWLRPVILLPASALTGLSSEQLEALLAHELAHIRRHDYLVNMLQAVVETLGFYHPAVWWVSHKIRIERENCCDDLAVSISGDRVRYARALTSMEEIRGSHGGLAVAAAGGNLFGRIRRLIGKEASNSSRAGWIPSVITILLIAIIAIPTTLALTANDKTPHSAKFLLDKMLEHRSQVRNLQYVAEDKIWRDAAAEKDRFEDQIKSMRESGIPERQLERIRQSITEAPESRYQILKCTVDDEERIKIEQTGGTYDSSGKKVPNNEKMIWAWNGVVATDFSQRSGLPASATIRDMPQMATRLGHPWKSFTGIFCGLLEETIAAEIPVSVEKLKDGTYRVAFDYKTSRYVAIIDPSKGYTCALQESYNKQGQLNSRSTAKHEEVVKGIWFPVSGQREEYTPDGSVRHKSTVNSSQIRINDPAFNTVYFDVDMPEGTAIRDDVQGKQYVVGSKRVYDLNEPLKPSTEEEQVDPNFWQEKFYSIYRLEDDQVLKRIAPPYIPERTGYFKSVQPGRYSPNTPPHVVSQYFNWDGKLSIRGASVGGGIRRLKSTLESVIGLGNREYDIPSDILSADMSGDWIVRKDTPQEELLQALEKIVKDETARDIDFVKQKVETEVIIAEGKYNFQLLPNITDGQYVLISTNNTDTYTGGGGGSGMLDKFLRWVGNRVGMNVVDETEAEGVELSWRNHDSSELSRLNHDAEPYNQRLDLLLKNLTRQTGLTFERETATVEKWFISENGTIKAPQKADAQVENNEGSIEGRIIDINTGKGIPGVELAAVPNSSPASDDRFVCTSVQDGTFAIGGLQSGEYLLRGDFPSVDVDVVSGRCTNDVLIGVDRRKAVPAPKETTAEQQGDLQIMIGISAIEMPADAMKDIFDPNESLSSGLLVRHGYEIVDRLLRLAKERKDVRLLIINAQMLMMNNGNAAMTMANEEKVYTSGYESAEVEPGKLTAQHKNLEAGLKYKFKAEILEGGEKVRIELAARQQKPTYETLQYRPGYDYQIPVRPEIFATDIIAKNGEPVVISRLKPGEPVFCLIVTPSALVPEPLPEPLLGKKLPEPDNIRNIDSLKQAEGKRILVCFWDVNQRPSRNIIVELAKRENELKAKGVAVVLVDTSQEEPAKLKQWLDSRKVPFACGNIEGDAGKVQFAWGVRAQPWLILTDEEGVVRAKGFGLESLTPEGLRRLLEPAKTNAHFYKLKHAQPERVAESLEKILGFRAENLMYPKAELVITTGVPGTNELAITGNEQEVQVAMDFLAELDVAENQIASRPANTRVYGLYHVDCEQLAKLLTALFAGGMQVQILPHKSLNKLAIQASESDHERIEKLIRLLDVSPGSPDVGEESIAAKPKPGITIPKGFDELVKRREGAKNAGMGSANQEQRSRDNLPAEESAINNSRNPMLAKSAAPSSVDKSIVKVDLSVVEVPPDPKMDTETIITIRNLLGGKITLPDSPAVADLLRKAAGATAAVKDESAGDKRVTQEQFDKLFDMLVSRGFVKILMRPTLEVVDGQTAKITGTQDSIQITPNVLENGKIDLQFEAALSSESIRRDNEQTPITNKLEISTRIRLSPGESGIISGIKQTGLITEPGKDVKDSKAPATEMLVILTPTIVETAGNQQNEEMVTRVYHTYDLVLVGARISRGIVDGMVGGSGGMGSQVNIPDQAIVNEAQNIANLIMQTIDPNSWYENNPNAKGIISPFPAARPKNLAIYQIIPVHQQIEKLLKSRRRERTDITQISIELRYLYTNVEFLDEVRDSMDIEFTSDTFLDDKQVETLLRASQKSRDIRSMTLPRVTVLNNETTRFKTVRQVFMSFLDYSKLNNLSQPSTPVPVDTYCTITPRIEDNKNIIIDFVQDIPGLHERIIYDRREMVQSYTETTAITNKRIPNNKTFAFICEIIKFDQDNQTASPAEKKTLIVLIKPTIILPEEMPRSEAAAMILNSQRSKGYTAEQSDETILLKPEKEEQPGTGKTQFMFDIKILTVSDEFMKYIGLDPNSVASSKGWLDYLIHSSDDSASFVIDQLHAELIIKSAATHKNSQVLTAPQVLALSGKKFEIHTIKPDSYMLISLGEPNALSGEPDSKPNRIELGTTVRLTPNLTPDRKNVDLDFEWEYRRLRGFKEQTGRDGKVQKFPIVDVDRIKTPCTVPDGKTLLIAGKKITEEVEVESKTPVLGNLPLIGGLFSNHSKIKDQRTLLIMVKPSINPPIKAPPKLQPIDPNDPLVKQLEEKFKRSAKPK